MSNQTHNPKIQDTEVIQNVLLALAQAVDLDQALEIILVNLRNVLDYDRAGLFLLDENLRFILERDASSEEKQFSSARAADDPIISQLENGKRPLVFRDIQEDGQFEDWKDMHSIRSWIGAPLLIGGRLIGFLSIGSLDAGLYNESDARMIQTFANQIASLLERVWIHEQYDRRTEELEVISAFSIAMGQADGTDIILSAIFNQISELFGEQECSILFPDEKGKRLTVKFSMDSDLTGLSQPRGVDILWDVFLTGQSEVLSNPDPELINNSSTAIRKLSEGKQSRVVVPLKSAGVITGVLFSGFSYRRIFSKTDISLFNSIAEIAGNAFERIIVLKELENQIQTRTDHLSALYEINAFASEQFELDSILEKTLKQILDSLKSESGLIYLFNSSRNEIEPACQYNLSLSFNTSVETINLDENPWKSISKESKPIIYSHLNNKNLYKQLVRFHHTEDCDQLLLSPIQTKMETLGILLGFSRGVIEYSQEELTLLQTISNQLAIFIERARLISKAEHAAVIEERARLARELHDSVTQLIYGQLLFAGAGKRVLDQENIQLASQYLNNIENQAQQALKEMRLLVYELGSIDQLDQGLKNALMHRLEAVEKRSGIETQLQIDQGIEIDELVEMELYRIAQEALNNTLKHSASKSVTISLRKDGDKISLEIADDGCGFDYENRDIEGGLGLSSMHGRAKAIGGEFSIDSKPGEGTRVTISI